MSYFRTKICVGKKVGFANMPTLIACFKSVREGHRIRHSGLFANTGRAANIARLRELLGSMTTSAEKASRPSQEQQQRQFFRLALAAAAA